MKSKLTLQRPSYHWISSNVPHTTGVLRQQLFAESILCTLVSDDVLIDAEVIQPELGTQCSHQRIVCMAGLRSAMAVQATVASVCFILLCWSSCVQFPSFSIFEGGGKLEKHLDCPFELYFWHSFVIVSTFENTRICM